MRAIAIIVISLGVIALTANSHSSAQTLQTTPVQAYNMACLDYGNEVPCSLVR